MTRCIYHRYSWREETHISWEFFFLHFVKPKLQRKFNGGKKCGLKTKAATQPQNKATSTLARPIFFGPSIHSPFGRRRAVAQVADFLGPSSAPPWPPPPRHPPPQACPTGRSYDGWNMLNYLAGEVDMPERNLPRCVICPGPPQAGSPPACPPPGHAVTCDAPRKYSSAPCCSPSWSRRHA